MEPNRNYRCLPAISYNNNIIEKVLEFKYLGVKLYPQLTFYNHVNYLKGKITGKIEYLSQLKPFMPQNVNMTLYKILILPHFKYNDVVYNNLSVRDSYTTTFPKYVP